MSHNMDITASNMTALTRQYEAIAQNLANVNTVGFKRRVCNFQQLLDQAISTPANPAEPSTQGVIKNNVVLDFRQGSLQQTGRPLDVAIEGNGYFVINTPDGSLYTRKGVFMTNDRNQLVDTQGRIVAGEGGILTLPDDVGLDRVSIGSDGTIWANDDEYGKLKIVEFQQGEELHPVGDSCFRFDGKSKPAKASDYVLHQGFQEKSNVAAVEELIKLIQVTRLYEANVKSARTIDERLKSLLAVAQG